ncbi:cytochrome c biogenesis protein CcdC [Psychrobacillus glaciei]|uniref:Cytochrome c biogenesis protein CcdC n=1 Tax=Psychrobacillus glaciei TaxID=2283160 RepID=A0A5J6SQR6_9BACI|nr:cytochrome c biogenesis protein CcdC [Psychrobacillus glaciei]QFG00003.1 cytochrome c biogenesis protein CcdC [Psychrobacillus glaciei]
MDTSSFYGLIIIIAILVLWRKGRSMYRPIKGNGKRILLPILYFFPALGLLFSPNMHVTWIWSSIAILVGMILSIPLIWTTQFEIREDQCIYAKKNISFFVAFIIILAIRFILRRYLNEIDPSNVMALFMIVAISYIIPWRLISFLKFRKVYKASYKY